MSLKKKTIVKEVRKGKETDKDYEKKKNVIITYNELRSKILLVVISAIISTLLVPFYGSMIDAEIRIGDKIYDIGWAITYIILTILIWILLKVLFYYATKKSNNKYGE